MVSTKGRFFMAQEFIFTKSEIAELEKELETLKVEGRQEIKEKIQVALSFGDLSENAEYDEARNDQGKLEARISELEYILANATIIEEDSISTEVIGAGTKVTIKDMEFGDIYKFEIVNSASSFLKKGGDENIKSDDSPVAKALEGHRVGDIVEVEAPCGIVKYKVIGIFR